MTQLKIYKNRTRRRVHGRDEDPDFGDFIAWGMNVDSFTTQ